MSLILDALNKSRSDSAEVPGLASEHYREQSPRTWLRVLPWVALALAVLVIAWLLLSGGDEPEENIVAPVAELSRNLGSAATSVTEKLKARADQGRQRRAAQALAADATPAPAAAVPQQTAGEPSRQEDSVPPAASPDKAPATSTRQAAAPVDAEAIEALYAQRKRAGQELLARAARAKAAETAARDAAEEAPVAETAARDVADEAPVDVEQVLRQAQQDVANAGLVEHPAPFLTSLSQQVKNTIPTILYQRHDYNSQAGRSSVTLNGKTVRAGGTPTPGLRVDEIIEDSVILDYRGTQFRLRALNSWVNL